MIGLLKFVLAVQWLLCTHTFITTSAIQGICDVPDKNISLSSLSLPYYEAQDSTGDTVKKIYIGVCNSLRDLPPSISSICDPNAHVCITNIVNGLEEEYIPNAGSVSEGLIPENSHFKMEFLSGETCKEDPSKKVMTRVDFFCTIPDASDNSILYAGILGDCGHQVFWHSSLACSEDLMRQPDDMSTCVIKVPGYDTVIELSVWASKEGHYLAKSSATDKQDTGGDKFYHLNLCTSIQNSPCPTGSVVCQVDQSQTKVIKTLANFTDTSTLRYNQDREVIRLQYPKGNGEQSVNIKIECDRDAHTPQVIMEHEDNKAINFRFRTVSACLVPPAQCQAANSNKDIYDLSSLRNEEWEFSLANDKQTHYEIKVCGSLPVTQGNPCSGQAGVCTFRYDGNSTRMVDAKNLGVMYKRPVVQDNGDIRLEYIHGSTYVDAGNNTCNMSTDIILRCDDKEYGPQFEEATACKHILTWATPAACPQKQVTSTDCTVREPLFNNLFNLTQAHNTTSDHLVKGNNSDYVVNVCGKLVSDCVNKTDTICLDTTQKLTYMDGFLELKYEEKKCPTNPDVKMSARIEFTCVHEGGVGVPELVSDDDCQIEMVWRSNLACPPHYMVQCSVPTPKGFVDLTSLSLPHENYQVSLDNGDIFVLNLCRSLVHTNQTKCPYKSSACLIQKDYDSMGVNLGQLHSSIKVDRQGNPFILYTLGSVCTNQRSSHTHMQTKINFECAPGMFDSEPEFQELSDCHYIFLWKHAVACPVKTTSGNCSVTSPESGFTFNLTSLNRPQAWKWNNTYHEILNHYDLNICGPLEGSGCGAGSGVCDNNNLNLGLANSNLTYTDGQLELIYHGGKCPGQDSIPAETKIKFRCPPNRFLSSGNAELDGPWRSTIQKTSSMCYIHIDFVTDLACDHQVYCDVTMDNVVYPLTKLRRHDINYKMVDTQGNDFSLNICGPLVPTDVPSSGCNPQGACGMIDGRYIGLGKVHTSPEVTGTGKDRKIIVRYTGGDICRDNITWSSRVFFECDSMMDQNSKFGSPRLIGIDSDKCEARFLMTTRLACENITKDVVLHEPDSCKLYHPGKNKYIDISPLHNKENYRLYPNPENVQEYFEIQPCGTLVSSCNASICKVTSTQNYSLGNMNDVKYYPDSDWLRVQYQMGYVCDANTNSRFMTKIYYSCDPSVDGVGYPTIEMDGVLDCLLMLNWRSRVICDQIEIDTYENNIHHDTTDDNYDTKIEPIYEQEVSAGGGSSWGVVIAVVMLMCLGIYVYRSDKARHNLARLLTEVRARMPVRLGGRAHRDSTFLISGYNAPNSGNGFLDDDDDLIT